MPAALEIFEKLKGDPVPRQDLAQALGLTSYANIQTQLNRFEKQGFVEDLGDHVYKLTDAGKNEMGKLQTMGMSQNEAGLSEMDFFTKLGRLTGAAPQIKQPGLSEEAFIEQITNQVWNGGDPHDLNWVAEAFKQMGLRSDLATRWWHSWKTYLKIPTEALHEPSFTHVGGDGSKKGGYQQNTGRDYILDEDDNVVKVGEGNGVYTYQDALDLAKIRGLNKRKGNSESGGSVADTLKLLQTAKELFGGEGNNNSFIIRKDENGQFVTQKLENTGEPIIIPQEPGQPPAETLLVNPRDPLDEHGNLKYQKINPQGPNVIVIKDTPAVNNQQSQAPIYYIEDPNTHQFMRWNPGEPLPRPQVAPTVAPVSGNIPLFQNDKGEQVFVDIRNLPLFFTLEEFKAKQQREADSHRAKMEIAGGLKDLLGMFGAGAMRVRDQQAKQVNTQEPTAPPKG